MPVISLAIQATKEYLNVKYNIKAACCVILILLLTAVGAETGRSEENTPQKPENAAAQEGLKSQPKNGPIAFFPETSHKFEPIVEGLKATHDFIVENRGGSLLVIKRVETSCGCTVAKSSKQIAAGNAGKISIKFNTNGYGGKKYSKRITVFTNDPAHPKINLTISGKVKYFAKISPRSARLDGEVGEKLQMDISIVPDPDYPFEIEEVKVKHNEFITYTLTEPSEANPNKYLLHIENTKTDAGRYGDYIELSTNSKIQPKLTIGVYGYIREKKTPKSSNGSEKK